MGVAVRHLRTPHSYGYRSRTRAVFRKGKGEHGMPTLTAQTRVYKRGEYVVIKNDSAIHKGMSHRIYHGKVARVFDVRNRALGLEVAKRSREKQIRKRIYVRCEHVVPWAGRKEYIDRKNANQLKLEAATKANKTLEPGWMKREQVKITTGAEVLDVKINDVVELKAQRFDANVY